MAIQTVVIKVGGVPQTVTFDPLLQAYTATVPAQLNPTYQVEVDATDLGGQTTTQISFVTLGSGELIQIVVTDSHNLPVQGVQVTAYYRNITGGANHGRAEVQTTDATGTAFLHLNTGNYNLEFTKSGFANQVIEDFQVAVGIPIFINTGGTIPERHALIDNLSAPIQDVSVKIFQNDLPIASSLVAHQKTLADGSWLVPVQAGKVYTYAFEKDGYDLVQVVTENA
jgi:hypothetical protein